MRQRHRDVARTLLRRLAGGEWGEGSLLPREVDLRDEFDVSRGVVREALGALEAAGVVAIRHGRGAFVQPRRCWNVLDGDVADALAAGRARRALVRELAEARLLLEPPAAALAAERATKAAAGELAGALARVEDGEEPRAALAAFHAALLDITGNAALVHAVRPVVLAHVRHGPVPGPKAADECRAILDAVVAGDAEAARAASRAHIERLAGGRSS
jgi:GntR family transcriptional regulator, galactonate operon transcriptional repressor